MVLTVTCVDVKLYKMQYVLNNLTHMSADISLLRRVQLVKADFTAHDLGYTA
jgi:hypothetical protein